MLADLVRELADDGPDGIVGVGRLQRQVEADEFLVVLHQVERLGPRADLFGDTVNLASRLEGVNKQYGTWILASEATRQEAGEAFAWRQMDRVRVVGISQPVRLYELLEERSGVDASTLAAGRQTSWSKMVFCVLLGRNKTIPLRNILLIKSDTYYTRPKRKVNP